MNGQFKEIALAIIALVGTIVGGATLYSRNKTKNRKNNVVQRDINIKGDNNKIIGGDDNSTI